LAKAKNGSLVETTSLLAGREVTMLGDGWMQRRKTWEELASAASTETDPEKIAMIAEEIFAALEERERTCPKRTENHSC
jgi:hypothetical protein